MATVDKCANIDCKYCDPENNCTCEEITLDNTGQCEQLDEIAD